MPPPFQRLLKVLEQGDASPLDLAVLVRHALRCEEALSGTAPTVEVPSSPSWPTAADWRSCGVVVQERPAGFAIRAEPWRPDWLPNVPPEGVDGLAAGETMRRSSAHLPEADPFVPAGFPGFDFYKSAGQQAALRATLMAPEGSTLIVSLPTGEGKSLIFQSIAKVGFYRSRPGVTVVVTPTVALAFDHEANARHLGFGDGPFAYRAGDDQNNQLLSDRIRDGSQRLCFASPEAVCASTLTFAIQEAARMGRLRALVVDEAHLIDSWGITFRPDFQVLAALRRAWLSELDNSLAFRTVLLSATLTADTIETLRTLFPAHRAANFSIISAARLRPEIDYWVGPESARRHELVEEALLHLPRPAILYTSERQPAREWFRRLRARGFKRIGVLTGESSASERQLVINQWREGRVDLAVGTSAFGLGIDNPHVRAVIHACVPETLDRFYQEVGRGGRDGHASISLIVPSERDRGIATTMNRERLLTIDKARPRWTSMFTSARKESLGKGVFRLPLDVPPGLNPDQIDMVSARSTGWNVRALALLGSMGAIELQDIDNDLVSKAEETADEDPDAPEPDTAPAPQSQLRRPFMKVRVIDTEHLTDEFWNQKVQAYRDKRGRTARDSLDRLLAFLHGTACVSEILGPTYELAADPERDLPEIPVGRSCGGCPACRRERRDPRERQAHVTPYPWPARAADQRLDELLSRTGHLVVCLGEANWSPLRRRSFLEGLRRMIGQGVQNLVFLPGAVFEPAELLGEGTAFFVDRELVSSLPDGPTAVFLGPAAVITASALKARAKEHARIWLLPHAVRHPSRPDLALCDLPPGDVVSEQYFVGRL